MKGCDYLILFAFFLPIGAVVAWCFPRFCKHCGKVVWPGTRYVWHDFFGYDCTHFDLHGACKKAYDRSAIQDDGVVVSEAKEKNLKPIPEFVRFLTDNAWPVIWLFAGLIVGALTKSFVWGIGIGLLVAVVTRVLVMLTLRYAFKIDPRLVKPHPRPRIQDPRIQEEL